VDGGIPMRFGEYRDIDPSLPITQLERCDTHMARCGATTLRSRNSRARSLTRATAPGAFNFACSPCCWSESPSIPASSVTTPRQNCGSAKFSVSAP